ncbi:MAG: hypothetical protein Q7T73_05415 [Beijerinckiaceae bacterium]|nr:hypothetical protein [Beijerinckiaceae bacterium]
MILGLSIPAFTMVHVAISLAGIAAGLVWLFALLRGRWSPTWNMAFLALTVATSVTGFFFPVATLTPAQVVGYISLADLALALVALLVFARRGLWRVIYAVSAIFALYLNAFVAVVQSFLKITALHELAPGGTEPPFVAAQGALLIAFVVLGYLAIRREPTPAAAAASN